MNDNLNDFLVNNDHPEDNADNSNELLSAKVSSEEEIKLEENKIKEPFIKRVIHFIKGDSDKYLDEDGKPQNLKVRLVKKYVFVVNKVMKAFSFEDGVDILDERSVLYRRNKVIKKVSTLNSFVFIIFVLFGTSTGSDAVIAGSFLIVMVSISVWSKRLVEDDDKSLFKQQMAMYVMSTYIIIAAVAVFVKVRFSLGYSTSNVVSSSITQAAYILIYFALVVISLYQDSKLLKTVFKFTFIIMTVIHLTALYDTFGNNGYVELFKFLFGIGSSDQAPIVDIALRTLLLVVFMIALYSTVSITEQMNEKRKEELVKRRGMEVDFRAVVNDVFNAIDVFSSTTDIENDTMVDCTATIASKLSSYYGKNEEFCTEVFEYARIHVSEKENLNLKEYNKKMILDEADYQGIRLKTVLGGKVIKRLQLNQKCEDIVRTHLNNENDEEYIDRMRQIQNNDESQVILLCEMYDTLRSKRNYKGKFKHKRVIEILQNSNAGFHRYFKSDLLDRFVRYADEFEQIYDDYLVEIKKKR